MLGDLLESGLRRLRRNVPQQARILQLHRLIFCSHILFSHSFFNRRVRRDPRDSSLPVVKRASRNKTHPASTLSEHPQARERPHSHCMHGLRSVFRVDETDLGGCFQFLVKNKRSKKNTPSFFLKTQPALGFFCDSPVSSERATSDLFNTRLLGSSADFAGSRLWSVVEESWPGSWCGLLYHRPRW